MTTKLQTVIVVSAIQAVDYGLVGLWGMAESFVSWPDGFRDIIGLFESS
jgi:hypothetical protein